LDIPKNYITFVCSNHIHVIMMKKFLWCVCLLSSGLTSQAQLLQRATPAQQSAMVQRIGQTAAAIRTIECTFVQVKTLRFLNDRMTSQGRMLFMAEGGRLRWEYRQPYQYTFILNGQQVHIQSQKNKQTIDIGQSRLFQGIARMMMNSLTGRGLISGTDFDCVMYSGGGEWQALLTPKRKEMKKMFKDIRLHISSQRQMVTQVDMTEPSGDTTVITLKDVTTNGRIDEKLFTMH